MNIYIKAGKTDMRKQINSLAALVEQALGQRPFSGDLFLFCGRDGTMLKALYWDRNGFCLWTKRLEKGSFPWPKGESDQTGAVQIGVEELTMVLEGIDFRKRFTALEYERIS